jgi:chromate reductase, NAD(P)H dehydrogenase (quinone)
MMRANTHPEETALNVLAIAGSLRRNSFNRSLLKAAATLAAPGMRVHLYDQLASVPLFSEDVEAAGVPEGAQHLRKQVAQADALLIATPEYNQSMPGVLKNAIDWLSRPPDECLVNKPVAVVGASAGRWGTRLAQSHLRHVLYATEALVMPQPSLFIAGAGDLFDGNGHLIDERSLQALRQLLDAFGGWIARNGVRRQVAAVS